MNERKKGKKENRPNETTAKARKHDFDNGWRTQKEANPMETNQNMFSTNEHTVKINAIPQACTILSA